MRDSNSAVAESPLWCIDVFPPLLLFRGPRSNAFCSSEQRVATLSELNHHNFSILVSVDHFVPYHLFFSITGPRILAYAVTQKEFDIEIVFVFCNATSNETLLHSGVVVWCGVAWCGDLAWLGLAWLGLAWLGLAWLGLAWLGLTDSEKRTPLRGWTRRQDPRSPPKEWAARWESR